MFDSKASIKIYFCNPTFQRQTDKTCWKWFWLVSLGGVSYVALKNVFVILEVSASFDKVLKGFWNC